MKIGGIQKTSLIDYPNKVCAVFFASGCNFRCPYCYNPELVFNKTELINEKWIYNFLEKRKNYLDAILLSGGEITIQPDFIEFVKRIKQYGYLVGIETNGSKPDAIKKLIDSRLTDFIAMDIKSDLETYEKAACAKLDKGKIKKYGYLVGIETNGSNPDAIKKLIDNELVDFIAMDLKSDLETYYMAAGVKVEKEKIKKSVELIKDSNVDYEFRTTVVPGLFNEETAIKIGAWLNGSKKYVLQQFNNDKDMINKSFKRKKPYTVDKLKKFKKILENYIDEVKISGI